MTPFVALLISLALVAQGADPQEPDAAGSRPVTVELLDGTSVQGEGLTKLSAESVEVSTSSEPQTFAVRDLQAIRWAPNSEREPSEGESSIEVQLQDGARFRAQEVNIRQRKVQVKSSFGELSLPLTGLRSVRLAAEDEKLSAAWADLQSREIRNDLLVVRKGDALDFVGGVVGELNDKECKFLVKDREFSRPRAGIFGLVFVAQRDGKTAPVGELQTTSGDRIVTDRLALADGQLSVRIGGQAASIPLSDLAAIDFTLGKVKFLADLPMEQTQFAESVLLTPSVFEVRKNHTSSGQSLRIGDREFTRGLWLHSGVAATFRLGREYRKFTAVMGLDNNSPELPRAAPEVSVTISGDGKPLFEGQVLWSDEPKPLDLDVTGVRELEVRVTPGHTAPGTLEHLDLGDARVIK